jgi:predicted nucleotidyltransferase
MDVQATLDSLYRGLETDERVYAVWLEGSRAEGYSDTYSDFDLWLDVEDGAEESVLELIERVLAGGARLDLKFEMPVENPYLRHLTYHIAGTDPFQRVEVNVQSHSRDFVFLRGVHQIEVIFTKDGAIRWADPEPELGLEQRRQFLLDEFDVGVLWVERELRRSNYIEAFSTFETWLLRPLVELMRLKYAPAKSDFYLKHVVRDLPAPFVDELEALYRNRSLSDIADNVRRVRRLRDSLDHSKAEDQP